MEIGKNETHTNPIPLSIIIAIAVTSTHNAYLYWTCMTICSLIIAIKHTDTIWEFGKSSLKKLWKY